MWWFIICGILFLGLSFYWWRSMRLDCDEGAILGGTFWLAIILAVGIYLTRKISGVGMGVVWVVSATFWAAWCRALKWDFWEWLDVVVPSGILAGVVINLALGTERLMYAGGYLAAWLFTIWMGRIYRKIKWYSSGRLGFVGLMGLIGWAITEIAVELWQGNRIYWVGLTIEQWLATWILVASLVAVYLRSGRKLSRDLHL